MKRSSLVDLKVFRCVLFLLSFCIFFVTATNAQVMHRRLWPWWPRPYPQPWPMDPPAPDPEPKPSPPPKPVPPPGPSPCPPTPPKPQPKPPPAPSPSPCPPPQPQPKPPPAPSPSPCPPPKPQPKPPPAPSPSPCPPTPPAPAPAPKPTPPPAPAPKPPVPCPSPPKPPVPTPKPIPPPAPAPKPIPVPPPAPSPPKPENKTIEAVFFFGDSVFDTGNNNNRETRMKSNYRPYGMDYKFGVATGRFSNGMVASDYLSKYLGVKEIVPAYFDPKLQPNDLLTGVSFASGGAGYNPTTSEAARAIPMLDQLTYFQEYIERINKVVRQEKTTGEKLVGLEKTNEIISKSVSIVVAGSNDLIITYYGSGAQRLKNDIDSYTTIMADSAASFVLQLYGYGARRIGVVGTPPLGCTPSQRIKKKKQCNEELNYAAQLFNSKLLLILGQLSKTLPNSTLVYMDVYTIFSQMLETPGEYGFEETKKPCCKTGLLRILCKKSTSKICPNTSSYLFWDGVHPTQRAYKTINKALIKEYRYVLSK